MEKTKPESAVLVTKGAIEETEAKTTAGQAEFVYAGVGEYSQSENWKISLLEAHAYNNISNNYYSNEPDLGKFYMVAFLEAENISDESNYFNPLYVEAYADDYNVKLETILGLPDGWDALSGDVAAGKKIKGCLIWQVGEDCTEFEFSYKNDLFDEKPCALFKIDPKDID